MNIGNVFLIGVGGTGTHLAEPLTRLITFHKRSRKASITFVDGDVFEAHNAERQLFRRAALGKYKAQYIADSLRFINSNINAWITYLNQDMFEDVIKSIDDKDDLILVIAAVDNHATRRALLQALNNSPEYNWLFVTPGNGLDKGQVLTYGCINYNYVGMNPFESYPDIANPNDAIPKIGGDCIQQSVSTPQLISANAMAAMGTLITVQSLLDDNSFPSEIHFDVRKAKMVPNTLIKL